MSFTRYFVIWAIALNLLFVGVATAQLPSIIPPDIQAIFNKIQSGQQPTAAEMKRLQEWQQSLQQLGRSGAAGGTATGSSSGPASGAAPATPFQTPCPPSRTTAVAAVAPTKAEYLALVKSLIDTYGRRLGIHKSELDAALASGGNDSAIPGTAVALYLSGAASASVYAGAVAAQRHPEDLQTANNLAVALDTIPDSNTAAQVFLYVRKMAPNSPLPALNLGYAYFNGGNVALAQKQFEEAARLGPDLSGPDAGLGMLASCRGDQSTARMEFLKSLTKGFSYVVAVGYMNADKAQQQQQQSQSNQAPEEPPPGGNADTGPIPELPVMADAAATAASEAALQKAADFAHQYAPAATQRVMQAWNRVLALQRKATQDPDGALNLPRVFDKQMFELYEMRGMIMGPVLQTNKLREHEADVVTGTAQQDMSRVEALTPRSNEIMKRASAIGEEYQACMAKCNAQPKGIGDCMGACNARQNQELAANQHDDAQLQYEVCLINKDQFDTMYAQEYKVWKPFSDSLRAGSRDLYAFSQPVIDEIWAPALNEYEQAARDLEVMTLYQQVADEAVGLAQIGKQYRNLKCIPPPPLLPPKVAGNPALKTTQPNCPLQPPLKIKLLGFGMELDCEKVKLEAGEVLRVKVERNFVKKESAVWVGMGADLSAAASINDLADPAHGKTWEAPGAKTSAGISAEVGVGVRFNDSGAVQDVNLTSKVSASISVAGVGAQVSASGVISLEDGANLDAKASASASPLKLPGDLSVSLPRK